MNNWLQNTGDGVTIRVRVIPRASRNAIDGILGQVLKVRLQAPPVEGKANDALITFLSEKLNVSRTHVSLLSGDKGRNKSVVIHGLSEAMIQERLLSE